MKEKLAGIPAYVIWIAVIVIVVAALAVGGYVLYKRWKEKKEKEAKERALASGAPEDPIAQITRVFAEGRKIIEGKIKEKDQRDARPSLLLIGEAQAGKSSLLASLELGMPFGKPCEPALDEQAACRLWFFDGATIYDVAGSAVFFDEKKRRIAPDPYNAVLSQLKKDRPHRPIDGIIVAIPCTDLLPDPQNPDAPPDPERKKKAALLHQRIIETQNTLGMSVPVYVVVTQSDYVPGFAAFGGEVAEGVRQSPLGWSNPVAPGNTDTNLTDWVDATVLSVHQSLVREQGRRFAAPGPVRMPDDYFLFPAELHTVSPALRMYIDGIFIPSSFEEGLALRGIYFCGDGSAVHSAGSRASSPKGPQAPGTPERTATLAGPAPTLLMPAIEARPGGLPNIIFARDLFAKKIFPEASLARPSVQAKRSRERKILIIQIAAAGLAVFLGAALAITYGRLEREVSTVDPLLRSIADSLVQIKNESSGADPTKVRAMARAASLVDGMTGVSTNRLTAVFIPTSWVSSVDGRVEDALIKGYKDILLQTYRDRLDWHLENLVREGGSTELDKDDIGKDINPQSLDKTQEFLQLQEWMDGVATFDAYVKRFNNVAAKDTEAAKDIQDVAELAKYLLVVRDGRGQMVAYDVKQAFFEHSKLYAEALAATEVEPYTFGLSAARAREKSNKMFDSVYKRWLRLYGNERIALVLHDLEEGLKALNEGGADYRVDQARSLLKAINEINEIVGIQALGWVAQDKPPPPPANPAFERLLSAVRESALLGNEVHSVEKETGEKAFRSFGDAISDANLPIVENLLERDKNGDPLMKLNPNLLLLRDSLDKLLQKGFMKGEDGTPPDSAKDREPISWNVEVLKDVAKLPAEFEEFDKNKGFKPFVDSEVGIRVSTNLRELAFRKLNGKVLGEIGRSISPNSDGDQSSRNPRARESAIKAEVANFSQAGAPLREVLAATNRLGQGPTTERIRNLVTSQGERLLDSAYRVFGEQAPYQIKQGNFGWWKGEGAPIFEAFEVDDAAGLTEKTNKERTRVGKLSNELAEPVLNVVLSGEVLADPGSGTQGFRQWEGISSALRDYETQKPGNSVTSLERFVTGTLPGITLENCLTDLGRADENRRGGRSDFFSDTREKIRSELLWRCINLAETDVVKQYADLRLAFNRTLAERFPFSRNEKGIRYVDAAPDAVRNFLKLSTDFRKRYRNFLLRPRGTANQKAVARFLDKIENVRLFLEPLWGKSETTADGVYDVRVEFRVNQTREVGGNQIAEWSMRIAEEKLSEGAAKDAKNVARWRLGDDVRLDLRFAKNGPNRPVPDSEGGVTVSERTASFEEYGVWALLRMIAGHQTAVNDPLVKAEAGSHVLLFVVKTTPDATGGFLDPLAGQDASVTRVFIRVGVSEADKDKLLRYPDFPTAAPLLETP